MPDEIKSMKVADSLNGKRLDVGMGIAGLSISRAQARKLIDDGKVLINGKSEKASYKLQTGDEIQVSVSAPQKLELIPYDFPIDVVFEDDFVIVVNKPAGLVVHPAYGHQSDTLINALLARKTKLSDKNREAFRPGLVHRIDKGTSGLLVLAKTEEAHNFLARQFLKKTIHRVYWALCFSHKSLEEGRIETNLTRDPGNRQRFTVCDPPLGKTAITHYQRLAENKPFSLFKLQLETGRTHQIRVHLSHLQNPIVGDDVYNGKNPAKNLKNQILKKEILAMDRFALHAKELGFVHPETKKQIFFDSPVPDDLVWLYEAGGMNEFLK